MEIIRAYMLEVGDRFMMLGVNYVVYKIADRIYYRSLLSYSINTFGLNSQERIELITKHKNNDRQETPHTEER